MLQIICYNVGKEWKIQKDVLNPAEIIVSINMY